MGSAGKKILPRFDRRTGLERKPHPPPAPRAGDGCGGFFASGVPWMEPPRRFMTGSRRHLPAFVGTAAARLRTPLAVVGLVLRAFDRTAVAGFGTDTAEGGSQGRTPCHVGEAHPAQFRTIAAGADALGHLGFADTGIAAMFARLSTGHARLDAALILLVFHNVTPVVGPPLGESIRQAHTGSARACKRHAEVHNMRILLNINSSYYSTAGADGRSAPTISGPPDDRAEEEPRHAVAEDGQPNADFAQAVTTGEVEPEPGIDAKRPPVSTDEPHAVQSEWDGPPDAARSPCV